MMSSDEMPWVDGLTISEVLEKRTSLTPSHEAAVFLQQEARFTFEQLLEEIKKTARGLIALGIQPGEHIGIWSTNWPQWILLQFASAFVGSPLVNINPAYRAHELEYVLRQARIRILVLLDRFKTTDYHEILETVCPELSSSHPGELQTSRLPYLRTAISIKAEGKPGLLSWTELLKRGEDLAETELEQRRSRIRPEDVVNIQYTSGTTGFPKGVQLSHRNILLNAFYVGQRMRLTAHDRLCVPVPFYHCFGCVLGTMVSILHGATLVVPSEAFDAETTLAAAASEKCTAIYGVPAMFIAELSHPRFEQFELGRLRTGIMAGSPCPAEVMRQVIHRMGARKITIAYGLTEASPVVTQTEVADSVRHRVETVGKPLPGLDVKVAEIGTGAPLPPGTRGELMVRGHCVMKGYFDLPEETNRAITPEGWLHTGDLATQTSDGYFKITGRIKDMIIRGGENIYPREVEEFLYTMPEVQDVQVVGLPDEKFGEAVSAWIIPEPGQELSQKRVQEYCRDRIAYYKIPEYVIIVDKYPTTVTGKIQKYRLRELGIKKFGLEQPAAIETA